MPELNDAAAASLAIATDRIFFQDVSPTPDVLKYSTLTNMLVDNAIAARTALDVDPSDGALYVADFATVQDAFDAFKIASERTLHFPSDGSYSLTAAGWVADNMVGKTIDFHGSVVAMTGGSAFYGLDLTGTWLNCVIKNANFTDDSAANRYGIRWGSNVNGTIVMDCTFDGMYGAIAYQGTGFPASNMILNCKISNTLHHGLALSGEYLIIADNGIYTNDGIGIDVQSGNNSIIGNSISDNDIGVYVFSTGGSNPDHGSILGNFINHNHKAGIVLEGVQYGELVTGNHIDANGASGAENLGSAPQDSSFGIYVKSCTGLQITNNELLNNKFSLALEGITKSDISHNKFTGDNTLTTNHIKEVGGTNNTTSINNNVVDNQLTGGAEPIIATGCSMSGNRRDGVLNEYFRITGDITAVTATLANITGMTTPYLLAGRTYKGQLRLYINEATAADGSRFDFDGGTATTTDFRAIGTVTDSVSSRLLAMTTAIATDLVDTTTTGDAIVVIDFTITVNAAGTFIPRYAKEAHTAGNLTLYRGGVLTIQDVTA